MGSVKATLTKKGRSFKKRENCRFLNLIADSKKNLKKQRWGRIVRRRCKI